MFPSNDLLAEFERLTRGINLGFDLDKTIEDLASTFGGSAPFNGFSGGPGVDAIRLPGRFELHIDLPGVNPATVDLTVEGRVLTLVAERSFSPGDDAEIVHRGRRHGEHRRSFTLAEDLDVDQLSARSEHGVLIVTVPVAKSAQARRVSIVTDSIDTTSVESE